MQLSVTQSTCISLYAAIVFPRGYQDSNFILAMPQAIILQIFSQHVARYTFHYYDNAMFNWL